MKKQIALILASALTISLCGCGSNQTAGKTDIDLSSYPIKTDVELSYWLPYSANLSSVASDLGKTRFAEKLKENTGVTVNYIHPALGQESEAFNLLVASGELPDIVEYNWYSYSGGPDSAIANEVLTPLNDLIKKYAPNLSKLFKDNPTYEKVCMTNDGTIFAFPFIKDDERLLGTQGAIVRQDWLDELGLSTPNTTQDWENMLKAFRDKKGATSPLTLTSSTKGYLLYLFDSTSGTYVENNKIKYGPIEPEFKNAITKLNQWYKEGLLDKNYNMADNTILDSNILNNASGATFGSGGQQMGKWMTAKANDNAFKITAVKFPDRADGSSARFVVPNYYVSAGSGAATITTKCRYPELATKFLDYLYSDEGHMLANFGIEGESYNLVDGYPTYTDYIMKNPDGLSASQAMSMYIRANTNGPFAQDVRYIEQYYQTDAQKTALEVWGAAADAAQEYIIPDLSNSVEESGEYSTIMNEVNKYVYENMYAFISGSKSLDEFDAFVEQIKKMNIERALEIKQKGYDAYLKR